MTSTTNLPNPRDVLIESLAQDVEVAHTTHVTAYAINRAKTYGWVPPATSTGQENEPKSLAVCLQASDAFDAILRERLNHAFDAGKTAASQCLHQIQEPPTKTEALAHYSQQAILAMGEASAAAVAVPDERAAFEKWWSTPALWSHGHKDAQWEAWQARAALAATPAAWAKPVSELLGHINDVLPDNAFDKIDTKKWNAVSALVGAITPAAAAPVVLPESDGFLESHPFGSIYHRGKPSQMQMICGACPPMYEASTVRALLAGVSAPWLQPKDFEALQRFEETASDNQGHDIGKAAVARLAGFGCLQSHSLGVYSITDFGHFVLNDWEHARTLPFRSQAERDADQRAAIAAQAAQQGGTA